MYIKLASKIDKDSIVDGAGIRAVIWTQGCPHNCKGCHNPETHDFTKGLKVDIDDIKKEIDKFEIQEGITFSGGDPFCQPKECAEIAKYVKEKGMNVWSYTGYLYEDLIKKSVEEPHILEFLSNIDVLVDGKFVLELKDFNVKYRGSRNQRIIDVKRSLKQGKVINIRKYDNKMKKKKKEILFI